MSPSLPAAARTVDEAIAELAESLGRQIELQQVSTVTILRFHKRGAENTGIADRLARRLAERGAFVLQSRQRAQALAARMGFAPGSEIYGETAARIGKAVGADAIVTGSVERYGRGELRILAQAYSSQNGQNIASATILAQAGESPARPLASRQAVVPEPTPAPPPPRALPEPEPAAPAPDAGTRRQQTGPVVIEHQSCKRSGSDIVDCDFSLLNTGSDLLLSSARRHVHLFDQRGRQFTASEVWIGNRRTRSSVIKHELLGSIPTRLLARFRKVPRDAVSSPSLRLRLRLDSSSWETVGFGSADDQLPIE